MEPGVSLFENCAKTFNTIPLLVNILDISRKNGLRYVNEISLQLLGILQDIIDYRIIGLEGKEFLENRVFPLTNLICYKYYFTGGPYLLLYRE